MRGGGVDVTLGIHTFKHVWNQGFIVNNTPGSVPVPRHPSACLCLFPHPKQHEHIYEHCWVIFNWIISVAVLLHLSRWMLWLPTSGAGGGRVELLNTDLTGVVSSLVALASVRVTVPTPSNPGHAPTLMSTEMVKRQNWILKGTPSIPETYLSSSVAWGLNLRVGWWRQILKKCKFSNRSSGRIVPINGYCNSSL